MALLSRFTYCVDLQCPQMIVLLVMYGDSNRSFQLPINYVKCVKGKLSEARWLI